MVIDNEEHRLIDKYRLLGGYHPVIRTKSESVCEGKQTVENLNRVGSITAIILKQPLIFDVGMVLVDQSNSKPPTISAKCQNPGAQVSGLSAFVFEQNFEDKIEFYSSN